MTIVMEEVNGIEFSEISKWNAMCVVSTIWNKICQVLSAMICNGSFNSHKIWNGMKSANSQW